MCLTLSWKYPLYFIHCGTAIKSHVVAPHCRWTRKKTPVMVINSLHLDTATTFANMTYVTYNHATFLLNATTICLVLFFIGKQKSPLLLNVVISSIYRRRYVFHVLIWKTHAKSDNFSKKNYKTTTKNRY